MSKKKKKKSPMAGLDSAEREVYRRGLAAYLSSGNRPKVSQHAWARARVNSAFGKKEAAKIRRGSKSDDDTLKKNMRKKKRKK